MVVQVSISEEIVERSKKVMPGGVNSPVRATSPLIVARGKGALLTDVEGREYVDYCMSWGALLFGHAPDSIVAKVQEQVEKGISYGCMTEAECLLAEEVIQLIPSMEKVRLVSSGTEAVMSALRLARGATGKKKVVKFIGCYHGHSDHLLVQAGSGAIHLPASKGVADDFIKYTICIPFNDREAVKEALKMKDVAALIVEPVPGNMGVVPPDPGFLRFLREETQKQEALLIFDEVITGFRVHPGGAQALFGIDPDLSCFGKVLGGGMPLALFGGKRWIMDHLAPLGGVYQAGTLSGNPLATAVALENLRLIRQSDYQKLEEKTDFLLDGLKGCIQRVGSMFTIFFGQEKVKRREALDETRYRAFFNALYEHGIYFPPSAYEAAFVSFAHTDEQLRKTREVLHRVMHDFC